MSGGFTKLFSSIVTSSIWQEDNATRLVWITMLATADAHGVVEAAIPGLANIARVNIDECERAVNKLESPDKYSRTKDFDGRRIEKCEGGWRILNYAYYREKGRGQGRKEYMREYMRERRRRKQCKPLLTDVNRSQPKAEAEAENNRELRSLSNSGNHGNSKTPPKDPPDPTTKPSAVEPNGAVQRVFNHWNTFAGRSIEKPGDQGRTTTGRWRGHRALSKDKRAAIEQALKDFSAQDICGAITNYAVVLLGRAYFWSYAWSLNEFLTRGDERHKQAQRKWWQFLPDNFDLDRYRRQNADDEVVFEDPTPEEAEDLMFAGGPLLRTVDELNQVRVQLDLPPLTEEQLGWFERTDDGRLIYTRELFKRFEQELQEAKRRD